MSLVATAGRRVQPGLSQPRREPGLLRQSKHSGARCQHSKQVPPTRLQSTRELATRNRPPDLPPRSMRRSVEP